MDKKGKKVVNDAAPYSTPTQASGSRHSNQVTSPRSNKESREIVTHEQAQLNSFLFGTPVPENIVGPVPKINNNPHTPLSKYGNTNNADMTATPRSHIFTTSEKLAYHHFGEPQSVPFEESSSAMGGLSRGTEGIQPAATRGYGGEIGGYGNNTSSTKQQQSGHSSHSGTPPNFSRKLTPQSTNTLKQDMKKFSDSFKSNVTAKTTTSVSSGLRNLFKHQQSSRKEQPQRKPLVISKPFVHNPDDPDERRVPTVEEMKRFSMNLDSFRAFGGRGNAGEVDSPDDTMATRRKNSDKVNNDKELPGIPGASSSSASGSKAKTTDNIPRSSTMQHLTSKNTTSNLKDQDKDEQEQDEDKIVEVINIKGVEHSYTQAQFDAAKERGRQLYDMMEADKKNALAGESDSDESLEDKALQHQPRLAAPELSSVASTVGRPQLGSNLVATEQPIVWQRARLVDIPPTRAVAAARAAAAAAKATSAPNDELEQSSSVASGALGAPGAGGESHDGGFLQQAGPTATQRRRNKRKKALSAERARAAEEQRKADPVLGSAAERHARGDRRIQTIAEYEEQCREIEQGLRKTLEKMEKTTELLESISTSANNAGKAKPKIVAEDRKKELIAELREEQLKENPLRLKGVQINARGELQEIRSRAGLPDVRDTELGDRAREGLHEREAGLRQMMAPELRLALEEAEVTYSKACADFRVAREREKSELGDEDDEETYEKSLVRIDKQVAREIAEEAAAEEEVDKQASITFEARLEELKISEPSEDSYVGTDYEEDEKAFGAQDKPQTALSPAPFHLNELKLSHAGYVEILNKHGRQVADDMWKYMEK